MKAIDLIKECVVENMVKHSSVRAVTGSNSWWHVHNDEEIPDDTDIMVCIRVKSDAPILATMDELFEFIKVKQLNQDFKDWQKAK